MVILCIEYFTRVDGINLISLVENKLIHKNSVQLLINYSRDRPDQPIEFIKKIINRLLGSSGQICNLKPLYVIILR